MELVCWPANSVAIKKPAISSSFVARPPYTFVYLLQVQIRIEKDARQQVQKGPQPPTCQLHQPQGSGGKQTFASQTSGSAPRVNEGLQHIVALLAGRAPPLHHLAEQARQLLARSARHDLRALRDATPTSTSPLR